MYLYLKVSNKPAGLLMTLLLLCCTTWAQSGRGAMSGYVAFDGVDTTKVKVKTKVELRALSKNSETSMETETNERSAYQFKAIPMGEYELLISAPGFITYEAKIYIPSDFLCHLAVMLKRDGGENSNSPKK